VATRGRPLKYSNEQLVDALRQGSIEQSGDLDSAVGMLDLIQDELEAFGTGGSEKLQNQQMVLALRTLEAVCLRLGITLELPFRDFGTFRSYWIRQGASGGGGWQARRRSHRGPAWADPAATAQA
jgi:hypothetical protein